MDWIKQFSLFLFDFDGLLVNTEELHLKAYQEVCSKRGVKLDWDFPAYCSYAHTMSGGVKKAVTELYPHLLDGWDELYAEKKAIYLSYVTQGEVELMPGAEALLRRLDEKGIALCVVTNSPREQIKAICAKHPVLKTISRWFTREDYTHAKPNPDGYLTAIRALHYGKGRIVGFEDTSRGLEALQQTPAVPVVISTLYKPEAPTAHFSSFEEIPSNWVG